MEYLTFLYIPDRIYDTVAWRRRIMHTSQIRPSKAHGLISQIYGSVEGSTFLPQILSSHSFQAVSKKFPFDTRRYEVKFDKIYLKVTFHTPHDEVEFNSASYSLPVPKGHTEKFYAASPRRHNDGLRRIFRV